MRTTLTLDDDLAERLADLARQSHRPFKVVVNEVVRRGLNDVTPPLEPFVVEAHAGAGLLPGLDEMRLNELAWEPEEKLPRRDPPVWSA